jgi:hypothetical protein
MSADSLLETTTEAAKGAPFGVANLLSPACSSFDQFRNDQQSGEFLCRMVKSIGRGVRGGNPNMDDKTVTAGCQPTSRRKVREFGPAFCEGKRRSKETTNNTSMKGREQRQEK